MLELLFENLCFLIVKGIQIVLFAIKYQAIKQWLNQLSGDGLGVGSRKESKNVGQKLKQSRRSRDSESNNLRPRNRFYRIENKNVPRQNILTAKCPYGKMSHGETSRGEKSHGEMSGHEQYNTH